MASAHSSQNDISQGTLLIQALRHAIFCNMLQTGNIIQEPRVNEAVFGQQPLVVPMAHETCSLRMFLCCFCLTLFRLFLLGEGQCERFHVQCPGALQALQHVKNNSCPSVFWGGANIVFVCKTSPSSGIAIRMSMLVEVDKETRQGVRVQDVLRSVQSGSEHPLIMLFYQQMLAVSRHGVAFRPLIRSSEYDGEAQWLDYFQWKPLVFPPAIPITTCKLCVNLSHPTPVYDLSGHPIGQLNGELVVGVAVMKEVKGSLADVLSSLSTVSLLTLLVGYHCDLRRMIVSGHLHDAHEGNLLATSEGDESVDVNDDFRWHDFGDSFKRVGSASRERLHELRDHVQKFEQRIVDALRDTLPSLAGALGAHGRCFKEFTTNQGFASQCLGFLAVEFATDVVKSHTLHTLEKRKFLERVSRGFAEQEMNRLWLDYSSSSTTSISQTATWVRQLQQDSRGLHAPFELVHERFLQ